MKYDVEIRVVGMSGDREVSRYQINQEGMDLLDASGLIGSFGTNLVQWAEKAGKSSNGIPPVKHCSNCGAEGHYASRCTRNLKEQKA